MEGRDAAARVGKVSDTAYVAPRTKSTTARAAQASTAGRTGPTPRIGRAVTNTSRTAHRFVRGEDRPRTCGRAQPPRRRGRKPDTRTNAGTGLQPARRPDTIGRCHERRGDHDRHRFTRTTRRARGGNSTRAPQNSSSATAVMVWWNSHASARRPLSGTWTRTSSVTGWMRSPRIIRLGRHHRANPSNQPESDICAPSKRTGGRSGGVQSSVQVGWGLRRVLTRCPLFSHSFHHQHDVRQRAP